jgi:hypothetical protein
VARRLGLVKRRGGKALSLGRASHRYRRAGDAILKIRLRSGVARSLRHVRSLPVTILSVARYKTGIRRSARKFTVGR